MGTGNSLNISQSGTQSFTGSAFVGRTLSVTASTGLSVTNGNGVAGNPTFAGLDATTAVKGVSAYSTDAQVKTGTATTVSVTPSNLVHAQGEAKAWVRFAGATGAIADSYNVTSVTRNSSGNYTINLSITMTNANYVPQISCSGTANITNYSTTTTTACTVIANLIGISLGIIVTTPVDPTSLSVAIFGQF